LFAEYFAKLCTAYAPAVLLRAEVPHHAPKRFDKEYPRAACCIYDAWFRRKNALGEHVRKHKFDQSGRCVVRPSILPLFRPFVVKLLIYRADKLDRDNVEPVGKEK
jgi:hypothetical protein